MCHLKFIKRCLLSLLLNHRELTARLPFARSGGETLGPLATRHQSPCENHADGQLRFKHGRGEFPKMASVAERQRVTPQRGTASEKPS